MGKLGVIWRSADLLMAIDTASVVEVVAPVSCRPVPDVPPWIRGLFVYRGALTPLVDAASLLTGTPGVDRMANRVLVLRVGGAVEWLFGLWVDCVLDVERFDVDSAGGHPGFATASGRFLGPVMLTRRGQVQLVKPEEIFTPEQVSILTQRLTEAAA